ncbi:MAG: phenylacetate--CoA ligase [Candidatus Aquicultor secundus]|uniref:Phenylacetate-coenzyme A ligase n=2 Tax=Candidatus Aquicultor secundus TaxID=1973895 RepID=A0A2M7T9W6_9ACTN|nr:phenylacetate--CoA ligase [Candidatus Aquicultor secundus]NCO66202.1 phenylacetate--CoA ligase [Solirubrobacter sp.]OIO86573.1 MAG: phenylacetate--CoA ligase [Candidatus Aquicultor secundus]PIW23193.1 MAG: phenylacetate--CoA ligase [Candidatus Aquicultor secundus]PIX52066.1 MAG: phenylacetate--CoA ligase [Candidatus Aquicultor secundus]PIY37262.1 MAG: phenylacetate--CoA ligase [Candidatus Aquicultor secundus]
MIWNKEYEAMPRGELNNLQLERLQATVKRVYESVPMYKKRFDEAGIKPDIIKTLDDLSKLPFTVKTDLRDNYPFGLFAVPMTDIVRLHASSGTTGKSIVVGYTKKDIDTWSELMARTLSAAGTTADDVVHNAYGYGLFTGGLGIHYGAERIGASVVPISGGNTKRQVTVMEDFGSTILACTPSYALFLAEVAEEMGAAGSLKLKAGVFGAEPWSNNMRIELEKKLGILAIDIYGLSEIIGPGVAFECPEKDGLHVNEDHFIVEVIDPDTGEVLPEGQKGELVFTSLTKEGFPVIRYRTRDISAVNYEKCTCGRTVARMDRVTGRTDDMLIIRGVNVFPSQIESVLMEIEGTEPHYMLVVERKGTMDVLQVQVEVGEKFFTDEVKGMEAFERKIKREIESILNISVDVKLVEPKTIQRSEGKAKRVIDNRQL